MNPQHTHPTLSAADFPNVPPEAFAKVERYVSRMLTPGQASLMAHDIKLLVLRCEPSSAAVATNLLSTLSKFVRDTAPAAGDALSVVFTDAKVKSWVNGCKRRNGESRSLTEEGVRLRRLLRVQRGLPSVLSTERGRKIAPPPLKPRDFDEFHAACEVAGGPVWRGFVAAFGAGVAGNAAVGARFAEVDGSIVLRLQNGDDRAVIHLLQKSGLVDEVVHDGDWQEVVRFASTMRLYLQPVSALQTFRELALREHAPVRDLIARYRLRPENLDSVIDHLERVGAGNSRCAAEALRGAPIEDWRPTP
jgi:hypothetical protein